MYQFPHLGAYSPPLRTADYRAKEWMVAEIGEGLRYGKEGKVTEQELAIMFYY